MRIRHASALALTTLVAPGMASAFIVVRHPVYVVARPVVVVAPVYVAPVYVAPAPVVVVTPAPQAPPAEARRSSSAGQTG